jgi:hypothetical protein
VIVARRLPPNVYTLAPRTRRRVQEDLRFSEVKRIPANADIRRRAHLLRSWPRFDAARLLRELGSRPRGLLNVRQATSRLSRESL